MKALSSILIAFFTLLPNSSFAVIRDVGNGGDAVVLEFLTFARQVVRDVRTDAQYLFPEFNVDDLEAAVTKTQVMSAEQTILNGIEKDAINNSETNTIEVSRSRWAGLSVSSEKSRALVFHEYLGIMKIDDSDFKISGKLLEYYQDTKKKISEPEFSGRIFITDQENANTQGLITITSKSKLVFKGIIDGKNLDCVGSYAFNENQQILKSKLNCEGAIAELELHFWNADVVDYLRYALVSMELRFRETNSGEQSNIQIIRDVDAKKLR